MVDKNDWRLTGQMKLFFQKHLYFRTWKAPSKEWDHDHCIFCFEEFSEIYPNTLREGYATEDNYYWICPQCFNDFQEMFEWIVSDEDRKKSIVGKNGDGR